MDVTQNSFVNTGIAFYMFMHISMYLPYFLRALITTLAESLKLESSKLAFNLNRLP